MNDLTPLLEKAGLSKPEITVYLYLLTAGISSPPEIARGASLQRPNTYNVLRSLSRRGLIDAVPRGKRRVYVAKDPSALVKNMEQRTEAVSQALPDLRALYKGQKNKPSIKYLDGPDEIKDEFTKVVKTDLLRIVLSTAFMFDEYPEDFKRFRRGLIKQGSFLRQILTKGVSTKVPEIMRQELKGYYDYRVMDEKYTDSPSVVRICNDDVAIVNFKEPAFGTVLTDPIIADTFKAMFETMWKASTRR